MKKRGRARINYSQDMALVGSKQQWSAVAIFLVLLAALPTLLRLSHNMNWVTFMNITFITIIGVLGLNVITGMAGQISLGHSAFIMVGGYTLATLAIKADWPFWAALAAATLITGVIGFLVAIPSARLRGFYVAIVTLAFFFIAQYIIRNLEVTGGIHGLMGIPYPTIGSLKITTDSKWFYLLLGLSTICIMASANIARSRLGRAFRAVRDNDITAASLGINVRFTKLRAFFVGSLFAGLAGGLWASYVSVVRLDQFTVWDSIWYVGMIIIGGAGSTAGAVMGVVFLRLISQILHAVSLASGTTILSSNLSVTLTYGLYGLVIVLFISFQPYGLIALWRKIRINYKRWPFGY
ncbi:MAG: branched-chain amino acid ABC transporter permease [Chloroflexota bacterium]